MLIIYKTIILSAGMFGSIYLFSKSLKMTATKSTKSTISFKIINMSVLLLSGTIIALTAKKTFNILYKY